MVYASGRDEKGGAIVVQDPMQPEFARVDPANALDGYLALERIFPRELSGNATFREVVGRQLALLREVGAAEAVRRVG